MNTRTPLYFAQDADPRWLADQTIAVVGYGNQGRAQALNLRDRGLEVIVGNRDDAYRARAEADGFPAFEIASAVAKAQIVLLLIPDEELPAVFGRQIRPNLEAGSALVLASGYAIAFDQIHPPEDVDVLLLAPRMIGVGVRERFLSGESFYCFVGVRQDASGKAKERLLALAWAIGGLGKPAIEVTCKQEAMLDLFNEQAFGPAFGRVLLTAITLLLEKGLPPEAVLVEMYLSEEMAYTYRKMAQVGLVKQTHFHSQTSQYGALSRGIRFLGMGLRKRIERIYQEIDDGSFAREWQGPLARLRLLKFLATRQKVLRVEQQVRRNLGLKDWQIDEPYAEMGTRLEDPEVQRELETFEGAFEF